MDGMISHWMSLLVALSLVARASASVSVSASPANNTAALAGSLRWLLTDSQDAFPTEIDLAPLTVSLATSDYEQFQKSRFIGALVDTTPSNTASLTSQDIALISCDPSAYTGYLDAAETVSAVVSLANGGPTAVVLYSTQSDFCNYTINDSTVIYPNVFTVLTASAARVVLDHLDTNSSSSSSSTFNSTSNGTSGSTSATAPTATIAANMSTSSGAPFIGGVNSTSSATPSSSPGSPGGSTTAFAMIILYTITAIITALFLSIIISGAVRAHRHPERYGPRNITGRPRQSRARGIARAMLDTIPIVKFGDNQDETVDAAKRDLEMASHSEDGTVASAEVHNNTSADGETGADTGKGAAIGTGTETGETQEQNQHPQSKTAEAVTDSTADDQHRDGAADMGNNVCPICTDDFVKGQDVRLLPCSHQFHPDCIDPWLINVSGTCPLCRIDLNPGAASSADQSEAGHEGNDTENNNNNNNEGDGDADGEGEAEMHTQAQNNGGRPTSVPHRRLAGYLSDIRRARNATVEERLEALRRLRQSNMNANADAEESGESQGRRRHLTARLRDRFRIRTRQHGGSVSDEQ